MKALLEKIKAQLSGLEKLKSLFSKKTAAPATSDANQNTQAINNDKTQPDTTENLSLDKTESNSEVDAKLPDGQNANPTSTLPSDSEKKRKKIIYAVVGVLVLFLIVSEFVGVDQAPNEDLVKTAPAKPKRTKGKKSRPPEQPGATDGVTASPATVAEVPQSAAPIAEAQQATPAITETQQNANIATTEAQPPVDQTMNTNQMSASSSNVNQGSPPAEMTAKVPENVQAQAQQALDQVSDEVANKIQKQEETSNNNVAQMPPSNPDPITVDELKGTNNLQEIAKIENKNQENTPAPSGKVEQPNDTKVIEDVTLNVKELSLPSPQDLEMKKSNEPILKEENKMAVNEEQQIKKQDGPVDLSKIGEKEQEAPVDIKKEQTKQSSEIKNLVADIEKESSEDVKKELEKGATSTNRKPSYDFAGRALVYNCLGKHWACVDRIPYLQCQEHYNWASTNSKVKDCIPEKVYLTDEDCHLAQMAKINTLEKPSCKD